MPDPVETYIRDLRDIRRSGAAVPETSYYGALAALLNDIGKTLKPKVRCIINPQNRGAGIPDGGLFTSDQFQKASADEPLRGQKPARGVIEVKPTGEDAWVIADGDQVTRYWRKYRQVLVTNYRDFLLVGQDPGGQSVKLESYRLAENETGFWGAAARPRKLANEHGERLTDFLKRVMLHGAPLADPQDVAWFLASYAREAMARIADVDLPALTTVRNALEEALGLKFEGAKGEHFFRSSLVQTLFYGVFSAWVLWSRQHPPSGRAAWFNWHEAAWSLRVPMIRALYEQIATPSHLGPLGLEEVLDWTGAALNRVDRGSFFQQFEEREAVQFFYEPFLRAFNPVLRKELGVWYTPSEIVRYMVARVDTVLREELGVEDGLADPNVYVLDPGCGTGAYLVEVLKRIRDTLQEKGDDALVPQDVKRAAMERVFGFEILPAPFVVAHLQLGLLLQTVGAPLSEAGDERVGVYLTNALTRWEPPEGPKKQLVFPELEEERDAANRVKRDIPILVVLGNPPYNAFAGVSPQEEEGLVEPYKEGLVSEWAIRKFNLDDLYVRFFRLAERRIAEMTGRGVVCYISNFSYLGDPSFVVMRHRFLAEFDRLWFDCMNGDSRETGKRTPDGKPDPSVFSTGHSPEGIRLGTAIGLMVRGADRAPQAEVRFRDFWGVTKRADLLQSLEVPDFDDQYEIANPADSNRYSFRPLAIDMEYLAWPRAVDLCGAPPISGLQEMRKGALMDMDREALDQRMRVYYDSSCAWDGVAAAVPGLAASAGRFDPKAARDKVLASEGYDHEALRPYALRPFETQWCYYSATRPLWNEPRPDLAAQAWPGNAFVVTRIIAERPNEHIPLTFTTQLPDYHFLRPNVIAIPVRLRAATDEPHTLPLEASTSCDRPVANLSSAARDYIAHVGVGQPDASAADASILWLHALSMACSPAYLGQNADGIRQDWPRIPLPNSEDGLAASAELGHQVASLLDTEAAVPAVTSGAIRPELKTIAVVSRTDAQPLKPDQGDLDITARWGYSGARGVTMPGRGKVVEREYTPEERAAIDEGAKALGLTPDEALNHLGQTTCDVYLNDVAYWRNIPEKVWDYRIGGYQVIKKWLSYRQRDVLGRSLTTDEARYVTEMARRLAAIVLLEPALDANYEHVKKNVFPWAEVAAPD